jgi:predicted transposase/invertase (TIGR01784 family)
MVMRSMIPNPHDLLFKAVFGQADHARGMLRTVAPPLVAKALDWSTLTLCPGSFVDAILSHQHTDLLYAAAWHRGGDALVYFLFEHQSAPPTDGLMAHRLLRYKVRIWDRWAQAHPNAKTLPMIIPIVMYHGTSRWPEARSFEDLIDVPTGMRRDESYLVRFTYLLYDLSKISDEELREGAMWTALAKLAAMCLKHARPRANFIQIFQRWLDVVHEVTKAPNGLEALAQVLRYILEVNEHVGPEALLALLEPEIRPEAKEAIMTYGQQLREQGIQQGIQQGIEQARQQHRQRSQDLLRRMLQQRFGDVADPRLERRIEGATIEELEEWSVRVLSAASPTEVFADRGQRIG